MQYLVVHHSAVDRDSTAEAIAEYHVSSLGWPGIGYHWLIHWDGKIEYVGDMETLRFNVAAMNRWVVGICLPGLWDDKLPPRPALDSLNRLLRYLHSLFPEAQVVGHKDIAVASSPTSCPGNMWPNWGLDTLYNV